MKKYEYKFANTKVKWGFDYAKKIAQWEAEWNALGSEGWQFCYAAEGVLVFQREIE